MWNNDNWKKDDFQKECKQLIIEILLTKREKKLIESAEKYLTNASYIPFNIQSNNVNENWKQIKYINNILQKCQNINRH